MSTAKPVTVAAPMKRSARERAKVRWLAVALGKGKHEG